MKVFNLFRITLLIILTVLINSGFSDPVTIELNCVDYGDYGLVYYEPGAQFPYGTIRQNHGIPPHPDLRLGKRNNKYHKSFFLYDISPIPQNANIQAVRVFVGYQDRNLSTTNNMITVQGIDQYSDDQNLYLSLLQEYVSFIADPWDYDITWNDPQNDPIISHLEQRVGSGLYAYFGLRLVLGDMSIENDYWESKVVKMWVTYDVPPQTYDITVQNSFQGGEVIVDGINQPSGTTFHWGENSTHTLEAFDQDWPEPNNYFRVFQNEWKENGSFYSSNNPVTITVTQNATYKAEFLKRFNFKADNDFRGAGGGGQIKINGQPQLAPYFTQIIEGTNIDAEAITPVLKNVNGRDITYNFTNWSDGFSDNPRTFTPNDHTYITADFKGHLVAFNETATAYNNGRHIIQDPRSVCSDCWYKVYEDNGNIYFTTSVDAGQTWEPEKLVSDCNWCSSYTNTSPGMTYFSTGSGEKAKGSDSKTDLLPRFGFTWVISDEYGPFAVACRYYDMWSNTWSSTDVWFLSTAPEQVHPVIASAYRYHNYEWKHEFYIIYRETDGLNLLRFEKTGGGSYMLVPLEMPLPVTTENSINPSLISDPDGDKLYFCWEEEGKIYYSNYDVQQQSGPSQPLWESPPGAEGSADFNPSITYNGNGYVDIAWQYFDGETGHKFRHQHLNALSPSGEEPVNQVGLYWENIYRPSIGAWSESSQLASTVQVGSRSVYSLYYDGLEWDFLEETNSGVHPGVNSIGSTLMSAWTDPTPGLPYPVNEQEIFPPERGAKSGNFSARIYRKQVFDLSGIPGLHLKGKAALNLGNIRIRGVSGSQPWGFVPLSDSLLNEHFQQTVPLTATADMQRLSLHYRIQVWDY